MHEVKAIQLPDTFWTFLDIKHSTQPSVHLILFTPYKNFLRKVLFPVYLAE